MDNKIEIYERRLFELTDNLKEKLQTRIRSMQLHLEKF